MFSKSNDEILNMPTRILLFLFCLLTACSNDQFKQEVQALDSILVQLDVSQKKIENIDTVLLQNTFNEIVENLKHIQNNPPVDSISKEEARFLTNYAKQRKTIINYLNNRPELYSEIEFSLNQCKNLQNDLKGNKLDLTLGQEYFLREKTAANIIVSHISETEADLIFLLNNYKSKKDSLEMFYLGHQIKPLGIDEN